ncbi:MAG: PDZ domain-containing protein [bacterium]
MSSLLSSAPAVRVQRRAGRSPLIASLTVLVVVGVFPLDAQVQRVESTRTRPSRAEPADSDVRALRRYQHQLDSLARVYNEHDDLTMAERRRVEEELGRTIQRLEELSSRMHVDTDRLLGPGDQIRVMMAPQASERAAASMSRALMQVREAEQARPRGWIGLVVQGPGLNPWVEDGELLVRYFAYPRVISVDPSSPAQRAGVAPNDTLLAYNGVDVSANDISFTRLLIPNAKVNIRIRRDGRVREIPVTVAAAPTRIVQRRDDESRSREWSVATVPEGAAFPRLAPAAPFPDGPSRVAMRASAAPMAGLAPGGLPQPPFALGTGFSDGVAGAQLSSIGQGLAKALGVATGVLVTAAAMGSPAYDSGLMDGDVILKVSGQAVRRVSEVRELVALASENGDHAVALDILRQRKPLRLSLKW